MVTPPRLVAHLDMDAFYASVELLRRPELRGLPVVIGGPRRTADEGTALPTLADYAGRGVVTTATYEARAFGVHSAMGLMKAAVLAPHAILLPADFDEYRRLSHAFKAAVAELAPVIEDRGIDEIYMDLSAVPGVWDPVAHDPLGGARAVAQDIKNNVRRATGLSCSIGLAPNKLLAKLGSELDKPDGLTVLTAADVPIRIWPLPARKLNGIGPKAGEKLAALGIHTLGDLAACAPDWLIAHFGAGYGHWLHAAAHGHDDRPVATRSEPVSISRETTFERDLHPRTDRERLSQQLQRLCERLATDLQRKGYRARTVGVKLRFDDFRTVTRDQTLAVATASHADILQASRECLKRIVLSRRLRLLGIRASSLESAQSAAPRPPVPTSAATVAAPQPAGVRKREPPGPPAPPDSYTLPLFGAEDAGA